MFSIPEDKLPPALKDQNRLNVLFAPLRNRSVNPKDWEDKVVTWKSIIKAYCESNNVYSFTLSFLNDVFVRHGRPPPCLTDVVLDMINNREVEVIEAFLRKNSQSWSGWITDVVIKRPFNWSYNAVKKTMFTTPTNNQYVHVDVVKDKSQKLLLSIPERLKNKVLNLKELMSILEDDVPNVNNLKLLLHYLENQGQISIKLLPNHNLSNELDTLLIKIGDGHVASPITDIDVGIHTLEQNEKLLLKHVEDLEDEMDKCVEEAKNHLKKKHKQLAKGCLVKKHQIDKQLDRKAIALHNIQNCLEQLKGTHTNVHVWEAYKNALNAFNNTYKDTGINEEAVDDTMLKLGEALDINEDIQSALARSPTGEEDMTILEQELEELMQADQNDQPPDDNSGISDDLVKDMDKLKIDLPDVPLSSPDQSLKEAVS